MPGRGLFRHLEVAKDIAQLLGQLFVEGPVDFVALQLFPLRGQARQGVVELPAVLELLALQGFQGLDLLR